MAAEYPKVITVSGIEVTVHSAEQEAKWKPSAAPKGKATAPSQKGAKKK